MPGVLQLVEVGCVVIEEAVVGSRQPPKKPFEWQVVEEDIDEVLVTVEVELLLVVVVVSSLHPNHPGVLHVEVEVEVVEVLIDVPVVAVVSSKQPHHPGVWHVLVLVRVFVVVDEGGDVVLLVSFPVTSFQSGQS